MMQQAVVGIDAGTTSVSVVALNTRGEVLAQDCRPHHAAIAGLPDGYAEQNPQTLLQTVYRTLQAVTHNLSHTAVAAVGLTGQMHGGLLLDHSGRPLTNIITWQDQRAVREGDGGGSFVSRLRQDLPDTVTQAAGCQLNPGYFGVTCGFLKRTGAWPQACRQISFVADWLAAQICGQFPVTDATHAASSGMFDIRQQTWSLDVLSSCMMEEQQLPEVRPAGEIIGHISQTAADETGLLLGTPVCNAIGDNQAAVIATLPANLHTISINIGTGGQIAWRLPQFAFIPEIETRCLPGDTNLSTYEYMLVGAGEIGGAEMAWVNQTIRSWLSAFDIVRSEADVWQKLEQLMQQQTESEPQCEPFFFGTRREPDRRGMLMDIDATNLTPGSLGRAVIRGMVAAFRQSCDDAADHFPQPLSAVVLSGNAVRRSAHLQSEIACQFNAPVSCVPDIEEAACGAALVAGVRQSIWPSLNAARAELATAANSR